MKIFIALFALVAIAAADVSHLSSKYLPPHEGHASAPVETYAAPAPSYSAPVETYSAPAPAASAPAVSYSAPAETYAAAAPAVSYAAPDAGASYSAEASAPAHSYSDAEGYRYKTNRRVVYRRHRRGAPSSEYLPPVEGAASAPSSEYLPPAASAPAPSYAAPAPSYSAPAASESYEVAASAPAHDFSAADGYRYKTNRRVVYRRHRRDVSTEYLPPVQGAASAPSSEYLPPAASAPAPSYAAPAPAYSAPAPSYSAPAPAASESYEVAASAPAHDFSAADGYRYKTNRRVVYRRHRRDVNTEYLPPVQGAASAPSSEYLPPAASAPAPSYAAPAPAYSAPSPSYSAPAPAASESYEVAASAPAHDFSAADGYRYKTARRRVYRARRRF
ncbi:uncharacterized protein LOC142235010 isoform X1 [Haematobia irritans]|uniref:uncharacterized protein LOC142235010 isoform X1 n=1 Tax=Haematobia irritans TaxID=7368 RepID=UPI003F4F7A90